jgi:hypothetical protein
MWQSMETAPKDGTHIMAFGNYISANPPSAHYSFVWIVKWEESRREIALGDGLYRREVVGAWGSPPCEFFPTHWQPLPAPPEAGL